MIELPVEGESNHARRAEMFPTRHKTSSLQVCREAVSSFNASSGSPQWSTNEWALTAEEGE